MTYMPITPFGRPVDAVHLDHQAHAIRGDAPGLGVNKWEALRALAVARDRFGLSDRDLSVLQALLSFHPSAILAGAAGLVVHPANRTICDRLNGMPCSTLRRHLARLVAAGVILRRDSPNGKRYARRVAGEKVAFGFDLSPLVTRFAEVQAVAAEVRAEEAARVALREEVSLMRRDLVGLLAEARRRGVARELWDVLSARVDEVTRALRRRLNLIELGHLRNDLEAALTGLADHMTEVLHATDSQNEQHIESNTLDLYEDALDPKEAVQTETERPAKNKRELPSLARILAACPQLAVYAATPVRDWPDLIRASERIAPMLGIPQSLWHHCRSRLGAMETAVAVAVILQRFNEIGSPGGYLRHLMADPGFDAQKLLTSTHPKPRVHSCEHPVMAAPGSQL